MSPVHVIVGEDQRAEQMWAEAFPGAIDLYRFPRNVDAFERLTAVEAPVDLVVLTPAQRGPFNLTPDQFVARVLETPLGNSPLLAGLHVIVVGQPLTRRHPRAMSVSTLAAAIRLVKFGEIEQAPRPAAVPAPRPSAPPAGRLPAATPSGSSFSEHVISRIWASSDGADLAASRGAAPQRRDPQQVAGGGPASPARARAGAPELFARSAPAGFVVPRTPQAGHPVHHPARDARPAVMAGGAAAPQQQRQLQLQPASPVGAPGEAMTVSTGTLLPARDIQLANGAGYRGPAQRHGQVPVAGHHGAQAPVPPQLQAQVRSMVYGAGPSVADPLLTWSGSAHGQVVARAVPVPSHGPASHAAAAPATPAAAIPAAGTSAAGPPVVRQVTPPPVPLEPPPGAYGAPSASTAPADPFLRRAEQGGGDVSFG